MDGHVQPDQPMPRRTEWAILRRWLWRTSLATQSAYSAFGASYNEMTQTSSAIIVAIKPSMEICQAVHEYALSNARYSAKKEDQKGVAGALARAYPYLRRVRSA
jgi:hypothetical protein